MTFPNEAKLRVLDLEKHKKENPSMCLSEFSSGIFRIFHTAYSSIQARIAAGYTHHFYGEF